MYKKLLGVVVLASSFALSQVTFAHSGSCGEGLKEMISSLKLDNSQREKIKPVLDQLKSTIKDNAAQMQDLNTQIQQQSMSASMDQSTVNGLVDKKTTLIGNMIKAKINAKNQIFNVLNADQRTALQSKMQKMEEKMAAKFKNCHQDD
ncbi:Spy/CpxP family protein refolding chaperone [Legionella dresdenensis]|uniref:Spy/CpxP family protein refolding chaperone n=1 Tax=Legionella dresdenensis TaxID=450200 RepID=A0ABV8CFQ9_9GAMM